jgi:hypothetical protein
MSCRDEDLREVAELVGQLCNGALTAADVARLDHLLATSDAALQCYVEYLDMEAELLCQAATGICETVAASRNLNATSPPPSSAPVSSPIVLDLSPAFHVPPLSLHSPVGNFVFSYVVGAVLLGIGLLIGWTWRSHYNQQFIQNAPQHFPMGDKSEVEPQFVGRITGLADCRWDASSFEAFDRDDVPLGRKYSLISGFMEITYDTGAKVILQGPVAYEVESASGGFLSLGKLTARVESKGPGTGGLGPGSKGERTANLALSQQEREPTTSLAPRPSSLSTRHAPLFFVRTPTAVVTDLGTEFGVEVDRSGATRSHVFRGRVVLRLAGDNNSPAPSRERGVGGEDSGRVVQLEANEALGGDRARRLRWNRARVGQSGWFVGKPRHSQRSSPARCPTMHRAGDPTWTSSPAWRHPTG